MHRYSVMGPPDDGTNIQLPIYYRGQNLFRLGRDVESRAAKEKKHPPKRAFQLSGEYIIGVDKLLLTMN